MENANKVVFGDILVFNTFNKKKYYRVGEIINPLTMLVRAYDYNGYETYFTLTNTECKIAGSFGRWLYKRRSRR